MQHFDVAIAGGGPAGAAAAVALARAGRSVLLADVRPAGRLRVGEGLPPAAHSLLGELGVLEAFLAGGHRTSFGNVSAWGAAEPRSADFIRQPHGRGYQLDRLRFDAMLKAAAAAAGVAVREGARLTHAGGADRGGAPGTALQLVAGGHATALSCRWLVDAGGRPASLARRFGATRSRIDRLVAFSMLLRPAAETDRDGRTLVEADEQGWWYSALLPSGARLATYLSDADLVDRRALLSARGLWSKLMATRLLALVCMEHGHRAAGEPQGADASSGRLDAFSGPGWLAVGDAALSFDPLSSQGIANALHTGLQGARTVDALLRGDGAAAAGYAAHLAAIHDAYLRHRQTFYDIERRWPHAPFWWRRHGARGATGRSGAVVRD